MQVEADSLHSSSTNKVTGSGLYIDVENLNSDGQTLVKSLLNNWPPVAPAPIRLALYVRADLAELWRTWATSQFQGLTVDVRGVQHFSNSSSKNSADIAIATNAIIDLLLGRVGHIVVVSDDSDFISLYASIRDEIPRSQSDKGQVPFLWIVTDRVGSLSTTVKQYFPPEKLYVLHVEKEKDSSSAITAMEAVQPIPIPIPIPTPTPTLPTTKRPTPPPTKQATSSPTKQLNPASITQPSWEEIAQTIIEQRPIGKFKSTDCQKVIKQQWPKHPLADVAGAAFGTGFQKNIWPVLKTRGVKISNPNKKPICYEMPQSAKNGKP